jgi:hypothetical protein
MAFGSGSYRGDANGRAIELRIDRGDRPDLPNLQAVSGDIFDTSDGTDTFLFSFVVKWQITAAGLTGELSPSSVGGQSGTLAATSSVGADGIEQLHLVVDLVDRTTLGVTRIDIPAARKVSNWLRRISLEVDKIQGTEWPKDVNIVVNSQPVVLSVTQALQWAGVDLDLSSLGQFNQQFVDINRPWTEADLESVLSHSGSFTTGMSWRAYMLIATVFRDTGTRGILIDTPADHMRNGFAVFYNTCVSTSSAENFDRDYLRTVVHEVGHAFNLLHSFDPLNRFGVRASALSFMNYPEKYRDPQTGLVSANDYWSKFNWMFEPQEMSFVRHGPLDTIIMGGAPFGGDPQDSRSLPRGNRQHSDALTLELRLSPNDRSILLDFGEPLTIEARLKFTSDSGGIEVQDTLAPCHEQTVYLVQKPNGVVVRHAPLTRRCGVSRPHQLSPENNSIYETIQLSYDARGLLFQEPGRYRIQAVHAAPHGPLYSNVLTVHVRYPDRDEESTIVPLLENDCAYYLGLWGAPRYESRTSDVFEEALNRLERGRKTTLHPLIADYVRCRFLSAHRGRVCVNDRQVTVERPVPDERLVSLARQQLCLTQKGELTAASRGRSKRKSAGSRKKPAAVGRAPAFAPYSNTIYGHLARCLIEHFSGEEVLAAAIKKSVVEYLGLRGVPKSVCDQYGCDCRENCDSPGA